jgi:molecular chaperone IbpA
MEDMAMRTVFDLSPLYRSTVGFDRLFDMLDRVSDAEPVPAWPPYNVEKVSDDHYRIVMAVAGFEPDEIEIVQKDGALLVSGRKQPEDEMVQVLHRGIADRPFRQAFNLADYVTVTRAKLENGLLIIDLVREVPEEMKPRCIEIVSGSSPKTIEHEKAAKTTDR